MNSHGLDVTYQLWYRIVFPAVEQLTGQINNKSTTKAIRLAIMQYSFRKQKLAIKKYVRTEHRLIGFDSYDGRAESCKITLRQSPHAGKAKIKCQLITSTINTHLVPWITWRPLLAASKVFA